MIDVSLDRIAGVYKFESANADFNLDTLKVEIESTFRGHAGDDYQLEISVYRTGMQIYLVDEESQQEPLLNVSEVPYETSLRFDWNPKRFRELDFAKDALADVFAEFKTSSFKNKYGLSDSDWHLTQADIAFDLQNEAPESNALTIVKLGARKSQVLSDKELGDSPKTQIMFDRSGRVETEYFGTRGSDTFARRYLKSAERKNAVIQKYKSIKYRALQDFKALVLRDIDFKQKSAEKKALLNKYKFDFGFGYSFDDIVDIESFESALTLELNGRKQLELDEIPDDWWRFEFVLRVSRIAKTRGRNQDKAQYEFDPESVQEWLDSLTIDDYRTIDDPTLRAIILAIRRGEVDKKEFTKENQARINKILKHEKVAEIVVGKKLKLVDANLIPKDAEVKRIISRGDQSELIERMKKAFTDNQQALIDEVTSYFN